MSDVVHDVLIGCVCGTLGWIWGALYMQKVVKGNAEHAVMQDHRVCRDRKAAIVARIRGCPVEWVLNEMEEARDE